MTSFCTHQWWIGKKGWWHCFYKDKNLSLENLDKYKHHLVFSGGSDGKESSCNAGNLGSIPRLRRSPGERNGYPLQDSGLENSTDCMVPGVTKSQTRLSDFHFTFTFKSLGDTVFHKRIHGWSESHLNWALQLDLWVRGISRLLLPTWEMLLRASDSSPPTAFGA